MLLKYLTTWQASIHMNSQVPLIQLLQDHTLTSKLTTKEWELIIRQARAADLLAHLFFLTKENNSKGSIPRKALSHIESAYLISDKQRLTVHNEVFHLLQAFENSEIPLILLKGAAYITAKLQASNGRLLSDIDILVPEEKIPTAEKLLTLNGWFGNHHDSYDERYYRQWMHEIPPLIHIIRQSTLDVHHTILPPTANCHPDPKKLFDHAKKIPNTNIFTLSPEDIAIHSATHLFHEGEFDHGLRDLVDLATLFREFEEKDPLFWDNLIPRAIELDLTKPLYYGIRYTRIILNSDIPAKQEIYSKVAQPNRLALVLMDFLFCRALVPHHTSCNIAFTGFARWALFIRSHYLRMPFYLLIPHLIRKAWKKRFSKPLDESQIDAHQADDLRKEAGG